MSGPARVLSGVSLPHRLADLPRPPAALYLHGELPRGPSVAIVGTRRPTREAVAFTERFAATLSERGVTVLSGGAAGIDSAAHRGALETNQPTVVVAPAGWSVPFPAKNRALFESVVDAGGAYVSIARDEQRAKTASFFARNACLAALSHVLVVVEAPFRSGARNAARWARTLGRPLLIVPSAPWNDRGAGSLLELRRGGKLCTGPADVLEELERQLLCPIAPDTGRAHAAGFQAELPFGELPRSPGDKEAVRGAIAAGARHLDAVCELTGLPPGQVQNHVLTLTLEGVLVPDPSGGFSPTGSAGLVSVSKCLK
jgi:DNA processing protein